MGARDSGSAVGSVVSCIADALSCAQGGGGGGSRKSDDVIKTPSRPKFKKGGGISRGCSLRGGIFGGKRKLNGVP